MRPVNRDEGVATAEFALLLGVMLLLVAFAWLLGNACVQKMRLDRTRSERRSAGCCTRSSHGVEGLSRTEDRGDVDLRD
jgi:TadE-like protein